MGKPGQIYPGLKIGYLTIIKDSGKRSKRGQKWCCQCVCGEYIEIYADLLNIKNKKSRKSCGCKNTTSFAKNTKDISGSFYSHKKAGAKQRGLEFSVTITDLQELLEKQNFKCALSGITITTKLGRDFHNATASIDRIDSSKGYTLDNIQWVHKDVNFMKYTLSQERFIELSHIISNYNRNKI